ncbi:hypothetical protein MMC10_003497 [Thelotrema lepadinum]|nr:hypothetical protein [Thelotrema lepadinum]
MFSLFSKSPKSTPASPPNEPPVPQSSASKAPQAQPPSQSTSTPSQSSQLQIPTQAPSSLQQQDQPPQTLYQYLTNQRSRRQLSIFFLGATALTFSSIFIRSNLAARTRLVYPRFYTPSNQGLEYAVNGPVEAFKALQIATLTTVSSTLMVGGGLLWAFDISSVDDLRARMRSAMGVQRTGKSDREVEMELEAWIAGELKRRRERKVGWEGE